MPRHQKIKGLDVVKRALQDASEMFGTELNPKVTVGYGNSDAAEGYGRIVNYALYVHENLENYHPIGQAKFLSQPARENRQKYVQIIKNALLPRNSSTGRFKKGNRATLVEALAKAGLALLRDSRALVPVDTGALKNSGFVAMGDSKELVTEGGIGVHVTNPNRRIHRKK